MLGRAGARPKHKSESSLKPAEDRDKKIVSRREMRWAMFGEVRPEHRTECFGMVA